MYIKQVSRHAALSLEAVGAVELALAVFLDPLSYVVIVGWKQVIIEGFKSYREQVATEPFSPKVNCVGEVTSQRTALTG